MPTRGGFWRWYGFPVVISIAMFSALNFVWNYPVSSDYAGNFARYPVAVYLVGGSGLAMAFLLRAARAGRIARADLGLDLVGWAPLRRLGGVAVVLLLALGGWAGTVPPDRATWVTWGEFCFWFVVLAASTLAELLVFLGMGFCLTERGLREAGLRRLPAAVIAGGVCSVGFGLYHYTHEPRWWPYALPLMVEMALVVVFFLASRNFFLTFLFHNVMATIGFFGEQYGPNPQDPLYFSERGALTANLVTFVIAFVLLHLLEWKGWPPASGGRQPPDSTGNRRPDVESEG